MPDSNIYRESDKLINTFYSSLPQSANAFSLTDKEVRFMHRIKAKNDKAKEQDRFFDQAFAKRSIAQEPRESLNKSEQSRSSSPEKI